MKNIRCITTGILLLCMMFVFTACSNSDSFSFQYWNEEADSLQAITAYVDDVTDEKSENFIPEEDRIAVFDMDGTLYGEKGPVYIEEMLYMHRVLDDPEYKAEDDMIEYAREMKKAADNHESFDDTGFSKYNARAFKGMSVDEFDEYVKEYLKNTNYEGIDGLTFADSIFLPMAEIVDYLNENGFTSYVCSGTDRSTCRAILEGHVNISPENVIGCDVALCPDGYDGSVLDSYQYEYDNEMVRSEEVLAECWEGDKSNRIAVEIGRQPVMVFGNSMGDSSMAIYSTDENPYRTMVAMVMGDDTEREHGNVEEYEKRKKVWDEYGWTTISMKNDWKTVYGDSFVAK